MKLFITVASFISLLFSGCGNHKEEENLNQKFTETGGVLDMRYSQDIIRHCTVVSNRLLGGQIYRTTVTDPRSKHVLLAGFSAKPLPIGSLVSWRAIYCIDSRYSHGYGAHILEPEH